MDWWNSKSCISYHVYLYAQGQKRDLPWLLEGAAMLAVGSSSSEEAEKGQGHLLCILLILVMLCWMCDWYWEGQGQGQEWARLGIVGSGDLSRGWNPALCWYSWFLGKTEPCRVFLKCYQILSYHQVESGMLVQNKVLIWLLLCLYNTFWRHADAFAQWLVVYCGMCRMSCDVCVFIWCYWWPLSLQPPEAGGM